VRFLGIDVGARRIGLAVSDPSGTLARPWRTIGQVASLTAAIDGVARAIEELVSEEGDIDGIVIGWPTRLDGTPHDQTRHVQLFADALRARTALPITLQDERLSSHEAESRLAVNERDWRKRKARLDAAAAAVILQDYLDQRKGPAEVAPDTHTS
jgi:putative Holliday junction resolvase